MRPAAIPAPEGAEPKKAPPNLMPVIAWLENGCDPKEAAKELRVYQAAMAAPAPKAGASAPFEDAEMPPLPLPPQERRASL